MFNKHSNDAVAWSDGTDSVLVHVDTLRISDVDGWLRVDVEAETEETGRRRLGLGYYHGSAEAGVSVRAEATITRLDAATLRLAERWGAFLLDAVRDGRLGAPA